MSDCSSKKNIESGDPSEIEKTVDANELVLGEAVIGSDGSIISRKVISDRSVKLDYFISYVQNLSGNSYLFPLGRNKVNMLRYYTEIEQWATIEIN
jgi:hypothetical protein